MISDWSDLQALGCGYIPLAEAPDRVRPTTTSPTRIAHLAGSIGQLEVLPRQLLMGKTLSRNLLEKYKSHSDVMAGIGWKSRIPIVRGYSFRSAASIHLVSSEGGNMSTFAV